MKQEKVQIIIKIVVEQNNIVSFYCGILVKKYFSNNKGTFFDMLSVLCIFSYGRCLPSDSLLCSLLSLCTYSISPPIGVLFHSQWCFDASVWVTATFLTGVIDANNTVYSLAGSKLLEGYSNQEAWTKLKCANKTFDFNLLISLLRISSDKHINYRNI